MLVCRSVAEEIDEWFTRVYLPGMAIYLDQRMVQENAGGLSESVKEVINRASHAKNILFDLAST